MDISARSVICRYTSKETYSGVLSREVYLCLYFGELIRLLFFVITISFSISATSVEPCFCCCCWMLGNIELKKCGHKMYHTEVLERKMKDCSSVLSSVAKEYWMLRRIRSSLKIPSYEVFIGLHGFSFT